jgi:hypothetical protein
VCVLQTHRAIQRASQQHNNQQLNDTTPPADPATDFCFATILLPTTLLCFCCYFSAEANPFDSLTKAVTGAVNATTSGVTSAVNTVGNVTKSAGWYRDSG